MMQAVDVAIVCALPEEAQAVLRLLKVHASAQLGRYRSHFSLVERKSNGGPSLLRVAVLELARMGNIPSSDASTLLVRELAPHYILLVGICGGIAGAAEDFQLGDVVVSDRVFYYEPGKTRPGGTEPRGIELPTPVEGPYRESELMRAAREHDRKGWDAISLIKADRPGDRNTRWRPRLKIGSVGSGEKVIASTAHAADLRRLYGDIISIEMEAAGVAYACDGTDTGFLVIKGVSDYASEEKNDEHRTFAAATAAAFAFSLLREANLPQFRRRRSKLLTSDLLGLRSSAKTEVVLPGYPNPRHLNSVIANYPYNRYETAYDDVYCAFRVLPALEAACGRGNVVFSFDQERGPGEPANLILIGSAVSNDFTRKALIDNRAWYSFGEGPDDDHAIVDANGRVYDAQTKPRTGGRPTYVTDYALISSFRKPDGCLVVLAGCRAYGQVLLGDFLTDAEMVDYLFRQIPGCARDYQCVLEVSVVGRNPKFRRVAELRVRGADQSEWAVVNPEPLRSTQS